MTDRLKRLNKIVKYLYEANNERINSEKRRVQELIRKLRDIE